MSLLTNETLKKFVKKADKTSGTLRQTLKDSLAKLKMIAFNTTALPILKYVSQVWSPYTANLIKDRDRIHRNALRLVYRL